jgi:hypothetical protein
MMNNTLSWFAFILSHRSKKRQMHDEILILRKMVLDWEQTAKMLAMDLGHIEYADSIYEDIQSGLYEKVRVRLRHEEKKSTNHE